jgi:uncharacterized YccA/Bax inhibitor family protein
MKFCILILCLNSLALGVHQIKYSHDLISGIITIIFSIVVCVVFLINKRLSWFSGVKD